MSLHQLFKERSVGTLDEGSKELRPRFEKILRVVKMNGRVVPKDWPPGEIRAKRLSQADLLLFEPERAETSVFVVLFDSSGFISQSTYNEGERPNIWHRAVIHFDKWQIWGRFEKNASVTGETAPVGASVSHELHNRFASYIQ